MAALALLLLALGALLAPSARAAEFTVNDNGDGPDATPGDGVCTTQFTDPSLPPTTGVPVTCTLRAAIQEANAVAGRDTIRFSLPGTGSQIRRINVQSELPPITEAVVIDGTTQPGYPGTPVVEVNGTNVDSASSGLLVRADRTTIRGLSVVRFPESGVRADSFGEIEPQSLVVDANVLSENGTNGIQLLFSPVPPSPTTASAPRPTAPTTNRTPVRESPSSVRPTTPSEEPPGTGTWSRRTVGRESSSQARTATPWPGTGSASTSRATPLWPTPATASS